MSFIIVLSSNNKHKLEEVKEILKGEDIIIKTPSELNLPLLDVEENGKTYIENAIKKASALKPYTSYAIMSDDSGIEIKSLNDQPGIRSARFIKEHDGLLNTFTYINEQIKGKDKSAKFVCHIALINLKKEPLEFVGECHGKINDVPLGELGFGYDPIFIPDGYNESYAQLKGEVKNKISHRGLALKQLVDYLKKEGII